MGKGLRETGAAASGRRAAWRRGPVAALVLAAVCSAAVAPAAQVFDRWVQLQGAGNFRDVGGYDAGTADMVAVGRVYRSAALSGLTASDVVQVRGRGIRRIIDMRSVPEVVAAPDSALLNPLPSHFYAPVIFPSSNTMEGSYRLCIRLRGSEWASVFLRLADPANLPLNYHCQAGKDRTGVMTALLLTLLGVDREMIVHDYMLSEQVYGPGSVATTWIEAALDEVDRRGGISRYLDSIGVNAATRRAVRSNLLVRRPVTAARPSWRQYP